MKMTLISVAAFAVVAGIVLLAMAGRKCGKTRHEIHVSFDRLKDAETRNR